MDNTGYKQLWSYIKNTKKMNRLLKDAKTQQLHNTVKIKSDMNIPCDHKESMMFDLDNDNTNWKYAELLELWPIYSFYPFDSIGPVTSTRIPPGHT